MRIMLSLAALALAQPVHANDACLAAPTRDCLLEQARETALVNTGHLNDVGTKLILLAAHEEEAAAGNWQATMDLLLAEHQKLHPDYTPAMIYELLGDDVFRLLREFPQAPKTALALAEMLEQKGDLVFTFDYTPSSETDTSAEIYLFGLTGAYAIAGKPDEVRRLIDAANPDRRRDLTERVVDLMINRGDRATAIAIDPAAAQAPGQKSDVDNLPQMLASGDIDTAARLVGDLPEGDDRTAATWLLANAYAKAGSPRAAELIIGLQPLQEDFWHYLAAETYARIGDVEAANALVAKLEASTNEQAQNDAKFVRFVLSLHSGDFDLAMELLDEAGSGFENWYGPLTYVESIGDVLLRLDPAKREGFLARLKEIGFDFVARAAIARVQIKRGEFDAVTLPVDPYFLEQSISGLPPIAAEMARASLAAGKTAQAMEWAKVANSSALYIELALMLD
jgi:hypothetical protein